MASACNSPQSAAPGEVQSASIPAAATATPRKSGGGTPKVARRGSVGGARRDLSSLYSSMIGTSIVSPTKGARDFAQKLRADTSSQPIRAASAAGGSSRSLAPEVQRSRQRAAKARLEAPGRVQAAARTHAATRAETAAVHAAAAAATQVVSKEEGLEQKAVLLADLTPKKQDVERKVMKRPACALNKAAPLEIKAASPLAKRHFNKRPDPSRASDEAKATVAASVQEETPTAKEPPLKKRKKTETFPTREKKAVGESKKSSETKVEEKLLPLQKSKKERLAKLAPEQRKFISLNQKQRMKFLIGLTAAKQMKLAIAISLAEGGA